MMEAIDETLLNDDNDEDLDYDLDPKEESALLQEEADFLDQEYEDEDVLDINVDYDQMDVTDDKLDSTSDKSKGEKKFRRDSDAAINKRDMLQINKIGRTEKTKNIYRVYKRGAVNSLGNHIIKRSKTVLLNPRFKGPVKVHGKQLAWETPPPILTQSQNGHPYIQPWATAPYTSQAVQQNQVPANNYNPPQFLPNNSYMYMQQQHQMLQTHSFTQPQVFMNPPPPVMNQTPLLNHNMIPQQPVLQMDHCINNYHTPQTQPTMQQVPEAPKLPVHQRLGIPMSNFNHPPSNQMRYDNNQGFHNQMPFENNQYNEFAQTSFGSHEQIANVNQPQINNNHFLNKKFENPNSSNFNRKQNRKFSGNQGVNNNGNNRILLSPKKTNNSIRNPKPVVSNNSQLSGNVENSRIENSSSSTILVVPEDEDEETRQYRIKIEEQKRKREEVLRKKEENRLKNLSDVNTDAPISTVVRTIANPAVRHFQQKKFNNQHRPQHYPFVKTQVNTNNIVITGNDDQYHFNSRHNKNKGSLNKGYKGLPMRVVTAQPFSSSNVNSKIDNFDKEVDSKCLSSFLSNRVVSTQENLMQTNIVVVKNLATATTEPKLMKLCGGIGTVQKLQMATNERQATIHFDTVASAHTFYNKYRRYMIDLSMIQVDLVPCEGNP